MSTADTLTLRARREASVKAHIQAEAIAHDVAAALATFKHPRYDVPALGGVVDVHVRQRCVVLCCCDALQLIMVATPPATFTFSALKSRSLNCDRSLSLD